MDERHEVVDVVVERAEAMTVTFADGAVCRFPVDELRAACPCASCRARRERDAGERVEVPGITSPPVSIRDAQFAGAWGISFDWSDGHGTGIYPWASLRRWHDGVTAALVTDP